MSKLLKIILINILLSCSLKAYVLISYNSYAFAALKSDGSVVTWGSSNYGGDSSIVSSELSSNVVEIFSTQDAYAALKSNGSVVTWGHRGDAGDSSSVSDKLASGVVEIYSTSDAFAALKSNGSVITWGEPRFGGDSSTVADKLTSNVKKIYSTGISFSALKTDGTVVSWGNIGNAVMDEISNNNIIEVYSNGYAFAALKSDGSVLTWGLIAEGGDSSTVANRLSSGVVKIFSTVSAFAALKSDGSVVTWGYSGVSNSGGDSSYVENKLTSNVTNIYSNPGAFAALKSDGSVVTWGDVSFGSDSSSVSNQLASGVIEIFSNGRAFAALKSNGSIVTWGISSFGGDSSIVADKLSSGVIKVFSTESAFAALKSDGSVVTWGDSSFGGDSSPVSEKLSSDVVKIFSNGNAFAALKSDGSVVTWGSSSKGGDSSAVSNRLSNGVVCVQNIEEDCRTIVSNKEALTKKQAFIERFYQNILNRSADTGGMNTWLDVIQNQSAAKVALGFFQSQEFINLGLSNEQFVDILYQTLFDRQADSGGRDIWLNQLNNGTSRIEVIYGFLNAQEFKNLADSFGVTQIRDIDQITEVPGYVNRFYNLVLNRSADEVGFNDWVNQLRAGTKAGGDIAKGFFNSQEYIQRGLDDSTFLDICYRAFFNREADIGGKNSWLSQIAQGATTDDILNGFIGSQEFIQLAASYGINPGTVDNENFNANLYNFVSIYRNVNNITLNEIINDVKSYSDYVYIENFTTNKTCEGLGFSILSTQNISSTEEVYEYSTETYSRQCTNIIEKNSSEIYGGNNIIIGWNLY